jgi:DNA-binding NarL/FixJ family response regulator
MSDGLSNREIASRIHLSENTVKSHIHEILGRLDARNRVQAAVRATREGWV